MIVHVLRKPLIGTVAANALAHGAGALNIDECRVSLSSDEDLDNLITRSGGFRGWASDGFVGCVVRDVPNPGWDCSKGRWPANLVHDGSDEVVGTFPVMKAGWNGLGKDEKRAVYGKGWKPDGITRQKGGDFGSAARFFQQVTTE